jgi:aryl-alcohol dehydrogenase-like predicted oxidoreductase
VSFTNTRWGDLLQAKNMPAGFAAPSATDCYRFAISNPHIQVAISGPKNAAETQGAIAALEQGPLDEAELARMRTIGDHVHGLRSLTSMLA